MPQDNEIFHAKGVALKGYDAVAFFTLNQAVKGAKEKTYRWRELEWRFSDEAHLDLFKAAPEQYVPEYGGYCAFGASEGYKAPTKPAAFTLIGGKLYLNFAHYVKRRWMEKMEAKLAMADRLWPETRLAVPIKAHPIPIWWKYQFLKLLGKDLFE